jgi:hypothetical protein
MRRLILKGSQWLRGNLAWQPNPRVDGELENESYLLRESDGRMCCLGVDAASRGIDPSIIFESPGPSAMYDRLSDTEMEALPGVCGYMEDWFDRENYSERPNAVKAMLINDDRNLTDEERVAALRPIFRSLGITLVFKPNL